jgi:putative ATP-dependent endonuclease of OLD family
LREKYGLYLRGYDKKTGEIKDSFEDDHEHALTIRLKIQDDLEPMWSIINGRQEPTPISASARAKLNVFLISDYTNYHFSWNKGNPLYSLLRKDESSKPEGSENNIVINALREAKKKIDECDFSHLDSVMENIKRNSSNLGLDISDTVTSIDFKDISIKDDRVCLYNKKIPFRQKGKGSKRLASIAIQLAIVELGGIVLVDEIEQGLEADRIKHLIRTLYSTNHGQIFITTHSPMVIEELDASSIQKLYEIDIGTVSTKDCDENHQSIIRACPEAMYAKKVIVCEGKTEIGICRALDLYRQKKGLSSIAALDTVFVYGGGHSFSERAMTLNELGLDVCVFCDSDDDNLSPTKEDLKSKDIAIFDCESKNSIEDQVFNDIPWESIKKLIDHRIHLTKEKKVIDSVSNKFGKTLPSDWRKIEPPNLRKALAESSKVKKKEWFKRIDHGEYLGSVIFEIFDEIKEKSLGKQIEKLSCWIDNG